MKTFLWVKSILGALTLLVCLNSFIYVLCFLSTVLAPRSRTVQAVRADRHGGIRGTEGLAPPSLCFCAHWSLCLKFCLPLVCFGVTSSRKPAVTALTHTELSGPFFHLALSAGSAPAHPSWSSSSSCLCPALLAQASWHQGLLSSPWKLLVPALPFSPCAWQDCLLSSRRNR